jgi:hypothetical protein
MKASIEIVQAAPIPANVSERAVDLAAHLAALSAEHDLIKAARLSVRGALMEDPDYKEAKKLKKEMRKATAGTREKIKALETSAKERQEGTEAEKCLTAAKNRAGGIHKAITRKLADSGQMMLAYYVEEP